MIGKDRKKSVIYAHLARLCMRQTVRNHTIDDLYLCIRTDKQGDA